MALETLVRHRISVVCLPVITSYSIHYTKLYETAGPGYASYRWSSGETSPGIHVQTSGSFSCITESHDGNIGYSDTVAVKMNLRPEKPTITRTGDVLVAPEAYQHNWYRNSEWLRDERGRFLAIDKPGRYYSYNFV